MKETNLEVLHSFIQDYVQNNYQPITEIIGLQLYEYILMSIYLSNDTAKAYTFHVKDQMTIITTPTRVSMIWEGHATNTVQRVPLCLYENLYDDILNITTIIEILFQRLLGN